MTLSYNGRTLFCLRLIAKAAAFTNLNQIQYLVLIASSNRLDYDMVPFYYYLSLIDEYH